MKNYCLFHNGGFRTYLIKGEQNEHLSCEVTLLDDYPAEAAEIMNGSGKMEYSRLNDGRLSLTVKEIPSLRTDTDGSFVFSAFQIISDDESEKKSLDKIAEYIAQNWVDFAQFYRDLFSLRGGLHIDGDKLVRKIEEIQNLPFANCYLLNNGKVFLCIDSNGNSIDIKNDEQRIDNVWNNTNTDNTTSNLITSVILFLMIGAFVSMTLMSHMDETEKLEEFSSVALPDTSNVIDTSTLPFKISNVDTIQKSVSKTE